MAKILIVEDDAKAAEFIAGYLRAAGHTCVIEKAGDQALGIAKRDAVDLIILDVMLPGVSGFELCRRFRADAELYTVPILMLSAMASQEEVMHGLAQGADDYVSKPFDVDNLVGRAEGLLGANADLQAPDDLTSLPSTRATKREVQRRISRQEQFALVYAEMMRLREFAYVCGGAAREKAIRHLARALNLGGHREAAKDLVVGHMGGGHFVSVLGLGKAKHYCTRVKQAWDEHLPRLYESLGHGAAYRETVAGAKKEQCVPILDLLMCITVRDEKSSVTVQQMFEVLTQIRNSALGKNAPGIHFDRRV